MKLSLAALTSALLSTSLTLSIRQQQDPRPMDTTFKITSLTLNTPPTTTSAQTIINSISFRILATTGGTLDFECKQYDATLGRYTTEGFRGDYVYSCGELSFFHVEFRAGDRSVEFVAGG
ncbi:hypothetical protein Slin14017_G127350 [Septoria linicola]|nr:hypothetical protein Slin14017_G127350 [Septoria linicola]